MATLVEKIGSTLPLEPGERILCAAFVRSIASTRGPNSERARGPSIVAVSNRRLLFAPKTAFLSVGAWEERRLEQARVESGTRRSLGFPVRYWFEVTEPGRTPRVFDVERKEAKEFRAAFGRRAVAKA
jgi:hypothetical protein